MANKNFKVRHGLEIGDSVSITDAGVATGLTTVNATTVDTTNIEVTNIKAKDGTAAMIVADSTGDVTVSSQLNVDNLNINTNTISSTNAFTSTGSSISGTTLTIGTLSTGTISVGQSLHGGTVLTNTVITANISGTGSGSTWTVSKSQTVASSSLSGAGDITLAPNTTGDVVLTLANGGNLTNTRNYVFGAIRNATTEGLGDIWAVNTTGTVQPFRGISIDNSADTTKLPGIVIRSYNSTNTNRGRLVFERARGTAVSPTAVQQGDFLGEVSIGGCNGTGTFINDSYAVNPGFFGFTAAENWSSNTNLGTNFALSLAPTATTLTTGANLVTCLAINPQSAVLKGDQFAISRAKTAAFTATGCSTSGTTLTIGTVTSGTVAIGQVVQTSTTSFLNSTYIVANISGSGNGSTWTVSSTPGTQSSLTVTGQTGFVGAPSAANTLDALADLRLLSNTIKGSTGTTQITTSASGSTLALAGTAITLEDTAGTDYLVLDANEALFSKVVRTKITTASVAQGATYTPAATALNSIILTITAGSGTTTIDVSNLTVASENAVFDIMVYNNSGGSINANGFLITNGGNTVLDHGSSIANGARAIFEINCIDIYANAQFVGDAV